jgi:hypothetical protein
MEEGRTRHHGRDRQHLITAFELRADDEHFCQL